MRKKGLIISFEGIDGCGKTTQARLFFQYLREKGADAVLLNEPGGTYAGDKIRGILLDRRNSVELIEVKVVGPESFQGTAQLTLCLSGAALARLAREKHLVAMGFECRPEAFLSVPIPGCHVEIVDAALDGLGDILIGIYRRDIAHDDPAEADDRQLHSRASEFPSFHHV